MVDGYFDKTKGLNAEQRPAQTGVLAFSVPATSPLPPDSFVGKRYPPTGFGKKHALPACLLLMVSWATGHLLSADGQPLENPVESSGGMRNWSFQAGAALITANTIDDFLKGDFRRAKGAAGGEIYLFQVSRTLADLDWQFRGKSFQPQLEMPFVLGLVNERGRSVFRDYNLGLTLRWKDFPWNETLYTTLESGTGFSYTDRVMAIERARHPGRRRSHLKFYWPIQLTLAHPRHRHHQVVFLIHHQSGGRILDKGGSNHVGLAYRYVPREREIHFPGGQGMLHANNR